MKSPQDVLMVLTRRLEGEWANAAAGLATQWNPRVPLGKATSTDLAVDFSKHAAWARSWTAWAVERGLELDARTRRVAGTDQPMPIAVIVPDVATAARVVGGVWPGTLRTAQTRAQSLRERFGHLSPEQVVTVVRQVTAWDELDFELLCAAGAWFAAHDASGLTPRQVPIEGMHAKWLNNRQHLVRTLSGRADLGLAPAHPARVHFTYLDPDHLAAGGRRHDVHTVGDVDTVAYKPDVVIICENKDTVMTFPPVRRGVAVEGNGRGAGAIAASAWVQDAGHVVYWGDMDADGLEILAEFRATGLAVRSMLMDLSAFRAWERFGTKHDRSGTLLQGRRLREGLDLTPGERALYTQLCDASFGGPRRVEQERIPLPLALSALDEVTGRPPTSASV